MPTTRAKTQATTSLAFMDPIFLPWVLISEIYWLSYKLLDRRLRHLGLSASQARVLAVLYYAPPRIRPSLVATLLFQETQSITGVLNRIESRGLIRRRPDPYDRRAIGLELTDSGRTMAAEVVETSLTLYGELFDGALDGAEKEQLAAALRKVRALGFKLLETDARLHRAQEYPLWKD